MEDAGKQMQKHGAPKCNLLKIRASKSAGGQHGPSWSAVAGGT